MIPYSKQTIDEDDINTVIETLRSSHLTQGPKSQAFERAICTQTTAKHAIAVNSGTAALHIACLALGVGKGDSVWTSPLSFVASSNCALYCGASVDFVDVELSTGNMDISALEKKLIEAKKTETLPSVIIPVHLCGLPCDMERLHQLSKIYDFLIIEDACHALGAIDNDAPIGSGKYSNITVFSFHAVKNITTAEGGMALTNDITIANKLRLLANHGITKDSDKFINEKQGDWYHEQQLLGFNYRMSDICATLGLSQLSKFDGFNKKRQVAVDYYKQELGDVCQWLGCNNVNKQSGNHLFVIQVPTSLRSSLFNLMRDNDIWVQLHYMNITTQPYYQTLGFDASQFPIANTVSAQSISIPLFPNITKEEQDTVIKLIKQGLAS